MEMNRYTVEGGELAASTIQRALRNAHLPVGTQPVGYYHSNGSTWDVKTDASCGWEVATDAFMLDEQGHNAQLMAGCAALTALHPQINRSCGLHVHVDVRDYTWRELQALLRLWVRYEPVWFELTPPGRRSNSYCAPLRRSKWTGTDHQYYASYVQPALTASNEDSFNRYVREIAGMRGALNLTHWFFNHRIEFRLHSGTVNYDKIRRWIMLLCTIVQRAKNHGSAPINPMGRPPQAGLPTDYLGKVLGLVESSYAPEPADESAELILWIERRRQQFGARTTREQTEAPQPRDGAEESEYVDR
jgi:hypothetical protein